MTSRFANVGSPNGLICAWLTSTPAVTRSEVAGKEETDEETGLGEDDHHEHRVAAPRKQVVQLVELAEKFA